MGHRVVALVGCVVASAALGGCIFSYDAPKVGVEFTNNFDEKVNVYFEDTDPFAELSVSSGETTGFSIGECIGTATVVETMDGAPIGRIDEPACPHRLLTINQDGTLEYSDD